MKKAAVTMKADKQELHRLLGSKVVPASMEDRLDRLGAQLVGRPYLQEPLVGSKGEPEQLVSRLDGFDCVTFVETVLALALSTDEEAFENRLKSLRYLDGEVSWEARNHYMTQWIERNEAGGTISRVLSPFWTREPGIRILSALQDYPNLEKRISYLPVSRLDDLSRAARTGDLICFVSERGDLDVFHVGFLRRIESLALVHASQSAGKVLEEPLCAFLERNKTPGFMVARLEAVSEEV